MARVEANNSEGYFATLMREFGAGWNRFWFTPSDPLVLAVLRILVGCLAVYTIASYGLDLDRFFGPQGMLSIEAVEQLQGDSWYHFSVLDLARTSGELWTIHCVSLVVLLAFTLGVYSRLANILSVVVVLSYIERGPMLTAQFEPILAFVLFYLCFGPTGAALSVDRSILWVRKKVMGGPDQSPLSTSATVSLRLIQTHLAAVYLMMALGKLQGSVWWDGTALWWLAIDGRSSLVNFTWMHPFLVNLWTHALVAYELLFPVLIWNRLARPLVLGIGAVLWLMTALVTGLVAFALMMVIAGLAFVPSTALRSSRR